VADNDRDGGGFLARWSERKLRARKGADEAVAEDLEQAPPEDSADPAPAAEEAAAPLTDADMPPLETLGSHSDYSDFLSPGVSEDLRRAALTKLFHSPHLNITDGLDDYDEDYTSFKPLGDVMTADLRHRMEVAAKRLLDKQAEAVEAETDNLVDAPEDTPQGGESPNCLGAPADPEPAGSLQLDPKPRPGNLREAEAEVEVDSEHLAHDLDPNPELDRPAPEGEKS
jgi:hypothetical protein